MCCVYEMKELILFCVCVASVVTERCFGDSSESNLVQFVGLRDINLDSNDTRLMPLATFALGHSDVERTIE